MKPFSAKLLLSCGFVLGSVVAAPGAIIGIGSSTNWSALTGGSGAGGAPDATDTVTVTNGATLTVDVPNAQCANLQLGGTNSGSGNGTLTFQAGSQLTCVSALVVGNGARTGSLDFTAGGVLRAGGSITAASLGAFIAGAGTIEYSGSGAQTVVSTLGAYNHLGVSGGNTKTLGGGITVNGGLTIASGTTLAVSASNHPISLGGNWSNSGTFTAGSGIVRFTGAGVQSIGGFSSTTFSRLTMNKSGGTATADVDFSVSTVFTNQAGTFNASNRTITLSGSGTPLVVSGGNFNPSTSTITYTSGNGATIAGGLTYFNLSTVGNSGNDTFTPNGDLTVANELTVGKGRFDCSSRTIMLSGSGTPLVISGGTFDASTSTIVYTSGSGATVAAATYHNLLINGGGGFPLAGATTVNGALTLTSGVVTTGNNTLILATGGSISGGSASSYVNGNLRKDFSTGSGQSFTFAIGDGLHFAPINLASLDVSSAGSLTAKAVSGDHPFLGSSSIITNQSVNRYWILTNSPPGIVIATNTATFNFIGVGTDVDAGANTATFMIDRYAGGWFTNLIGTRTATNTTMLGLTAFGDFAVGNRNSGGPASFSTNTIFFAYTNRAALLADGWDFLARTTNGMPRNTETTAGASPPDVAYARTNDGLGIVMRIPVDTGDLWAAANNTRNSLFRNLSPNWSSVRLQLSFAPTQAYQQAQLALYEDDNNYVEVGSVYSFPTNPVVAFSQETAGVPRTVNSIDSPATNLHLRLDRDLTYGLISGFYSADGTNWVSLGQAEQDLVNPRLAIWVGGSPGGYPNADFYRLQIITSDTPVTTTLSFQRPTFVFHSVAGQPNTNVQRVLVVSQGPTGLQWTLTNSASWLSTSATSGKTPASLNLSVNTAGLSVGVHETALKFGASGAANHPATLNVKLIVNPDVRARASAWRGGKAAALSVWVDDSSPTMFNILQTNGFNGTYLLWGVDATHLIPSFFTNYYQAGMELGAHTVHHYCDTMMYERTMRSELESNIADILTFTPATEEQLISFGIPCGIANIKIQAVMADYFLNARGYNVNRLEERSPYDYMFLNSFNSHENDPWVYNPLAPPNPSDLKTVVDAAIAQGKWANLVFHGLNNDDGAVAYSVGKDIWVAPAGLVTKYILLRDRTVVSNYVESSGLIRFDCYRLPLDPSNLRSFETAVTTNDLVTLQLDISGVSAVTNLTVDGIPTTNYAIRTVGGKAMLFLDARLTDAIKRIELGVIAGTNRPPVLATNANVTIGEGQILVVTNNATDPDTNTLTFTLGNAPSGMTISTNGIINWTPGETAGGSNFTVTVIVTDNGLPALSASNSFTITVNEINVAPVLPPQSDRIIYGQNLLTVVNTASDADLPANPLGYLLMAGPPNASISSAGVITWTPSPEQVPSTNIFTTVVTDTNVMAVNAQNLSATNTFVVIVTANPLSLPAQTNRAIDELTTLIVTNTATHLGISSNEVGQFVTNVFNFTFADRDALLANGWDFFARTTNGLPRDTERTNGAVVSYDQIAHPGSLRIPVDVGDLWATANNSRNSLFRNLSSNWLSARLHLLFSPTQNFQQMQLALYQDDDNYVEVGFGHNSGLGGRTTTLIRELNGSPVLIGSKTNAASNIQLRLDRNPTNGNVSAYHGLDATNWVSIASIGQSFPNPRLGIWAGGSPSGFPVLDLTRLDVVVSNPPNRVIYRLLDPPAGATINTNGVIFWTPDATQGPGLYWITTVASDLSDPPLAVTNSFQVTVNDVAAAAVVITSIKITNGVVAITWDSVSNRTYRVQYRTNLTSFNWVDIPPDVTATGSSAVKTDAAVGAQRFYQVILLP